MKNTVLKGILQTLILLIALFLISVQVMQLISMAKDITRMNEAGYSDEEVQEALLATLENADEALTDQVEIAETAEKDALSDADSEEGPYSLRNLRSTIIEALLNDPLLCGYIYVGMFLLLTMATAADYLPWKKNDRKTRITVLINAALYLGCGIPFLISGYTMAAVAVMTLLYSITIIAESAARMIMKHTPGQIVFRVIVILVTLTNLVLFQILPFFVLAVIVLRAFRKIMVISFSQIRLDVLRKILRKTYAYEILLGLVLLMFAFALMLSMLEEGMPSFMDALWFCFATVTTIGYGDVIATTVLGRILSMILGVYGIIVVALVTSVIVNFYNEMKTEKEDKEEEVIPDEPGKDS